MPISGIDAATLAPRTNEAAGYANREQMMNQNILDQGAFSLQRNVEHDAHRAVESQKSETENMDRDANPDHRGSGNRNRKKKENGQEEVMAPRSDSKFDIMI